MTEISKVDVRVKREWSRILRNGLTDLEKMLGDRIKALTAELAEHADARTQIDHRLEELVGQVDALTAERDKWKGAHEEACKHWLTQCENAIIQRNAAEADNARLREALKEQIHIRQNCHLMPCAAPGNDSCECERMYRRALNTGKETK